MASSSLSVMTSSLLLRFYRKRQLLTDDYLRHEARLRSSEHMPVEVYRGMEELGQGLDRRRRSESLLARMSDALWGSQETVGSPEEHRRRLLSEDDVESKIV